MLESVLARAACLRVAGLYFCGFASTRRANRDVLIPAAFAFLANAPGCLTAFCIQFFLIPITPFRVPPLSGLSIGS